LDGWDEQLLAAGQFLIKKREEFVYFLDEMMAKIHGQLTGGPGCDISVELNNPFEQDFNKILEEAEKFREQLYSKRNKDISSGTTSVGPHRDDLRFKVGGIDIRKFGSQGQQRTAALSLKLSEIRLIEQVTGEKPILLLDDVLSELDAGRQSWLLESIQDIQTLISCTGLDDFVNSRISLDKVFRVKEGIVQEEKTDGLV
jgi:DNA replication and repair protein RecF